MNILTSIEEIVKGYFGDLFENIESFYLKNFLILIQGLLTQTNTSVSGMTLNSLNSLSHTTLTRFLRGYSPFWESLQKALWDVLGSKVQGKRILVLDDTLVERKGKQIPYASKQFDHCQNRFTKGQVVLTIGELFEKVFYPLDMLFANTGKSKNNKTKNELALSWLKANDVKDSIILADSWYTNSTLIEGCYYWLKATFIGQLKSSIILKTEGKVLKVKKLITSSKFNRTTEVHGKKIAYRSYLAYPHPLRIPVKVVVTRIENGSSAVLLSSDTSLSSEEIIHYYALRWTIESFFKFAKQNLSFSNCQIRSSDAQNHFMLLISVAYLIFNDLKSLCLKAKPKCSNPVFWAAFHTALSILLDIVLNKQVLDFTLVASRETNCPRHVRPLLQPLLLSCTS